jgi:hypothetical protein
MINTGTATPRLDLLGPIYQEGMPEEAYVAHKILTPMVIQKRIGAIPSFLFTDAQALSIKHSPKTGFATIQSKLGQNTYECKEAGIEEALSFEDYEILSRDRAWEIITRKLVHTVLRSRDYALSQAIFSATGESTFATNLVTASAVWAGGSSSTGLPLDDVQTAKLKIAKQTGQPGNAMVIGYEGYVNLCKNAQVRTAVRANFGWAGSKGASAPALEIPTADLASLFGLDEVIVAPGVVDNNGDGQANKDLSFIWNAVTATGTTGYAFVFRKSRNPNDVREVALGRTFVYDLAATFNQLTTTQVADSIRGLYLESYPRPDINADVLRCREYIDMNILLPVAGSLIKGI